jgi:hypothetical protein
MRQPAPNRAQDVLLVPASIRASLRRNGEGRCDGGPEAEPAEGVVEAACEAGEANEEDVCEEELNVCPGEREGEPSTTLAPSPKTL